MPRLLMGHQLVAQLRRSLLRGPQRALEMLMLGVNGTGVHLIHVRSALSSEGWNTLGTALI